MSITLADLPAELLELVLSQLPMLELLLSHSLVCKRWRDIIQCPTFLPHRKSYYQYKLGLADTRDRLDRLVKEQVEVMVDMQGLTTIQQIHQTGTRYEKVMLERSLPWLLSVFSTPDMARSLHITQDMFTSLHLHPRYSMCMAIIEDRFPHLISSSLSLLTLILCTARNMKDCFRALQLLVYNSPPTTELRIVELFYLISTYLLVCERVFSLPPRPQYLLYHAISLHHNTWLHDPTDQFTPQTVSGQAGHHTQTVTLTAEQRKIVHMDLRNMMGTTDTIRIMAYAGTGKTTTLVELCKRNPTIKFLLVVFNKSVEVHSKRVFPKNVTVKTANALSYKFIMETEGNDRFQAYNLKYTDLIYYNYIPPRDKMYPGFSLYHRAAMIMETLTTFYNSEERQVGVEHTPDKWVTGRKNRKEAKLLDIKQRKCLAEDASEVWKVIRLKYNSKVRFDHSSSMKHFQLANPDLKHWAGPHDLLLLDEAQDMNPCMLAVCLQQTCPKIVVGDSHQQIYSFRGAVNALDLVEASDRTAVRTNHFLTQSFRFGAEIAFTANTCLKGLIGAGGPDLVGSSKLDSVTGSLHFRQGRGKTAVLGRTNLRLFEEMVNLVCLPELHARPKIAFPNDPSGYGTDPMGWERLVDLAHYKAGNRHLMSSKAQRNHMFEKRWEEFVAQVEAGKDLEMLSKIMIVQKFAGKLPGYVDILMEQSQFAMEDTRVDMVFSTVHKFKGLEMDTVRLLDDFAFIGVPYERPAKGRVEVDELNLLYVALTRAKKRLVINDALFFLLTSSFINYSFELLLPVSPAAACVKCLAVLEQSGLAGLYQDCVRVGDKARVGGWLCGLCARSDIRRVNNTLGSLDRMGALRVGPGVVQDTYHQWVRCVVGPGRGMLDHDKLQQHEGRLRGMREVEVKQWVEEKVDKEYQDFMQEEDGDLLLVEEFENGFDEDDAFLLAAANA
eukprot:GFUD01017486.1.p1 GENE.GFUD01017486.1~~GFUD01017486.1.p1  ORF type:complete len:966 (+),score=316.83 GFUD01017486.1:53-2899(+)